MKLKKTERKILEALYRKNVLFDQNIYFFDYIELSEKFINMKKHEAVYYIKRLVKYGYLTADSDYYIGKGENCAKYNNNAIILMENVLELTASGEEAAEQLIQTIGVKIQNNVVSIFKFTKNKFIEKSINIVINMFFLIIGYIIHLRFGDPISQFLKFALKNV